MGTSLISSIQSRAYSAPAPIDLRTIPRSPKQRWNEPAIIDNEEVFNYGRLLEEVARHRVWLKKALNPQPGDVIAASLRNCWQFTACFLAASDLRAVFMPCNPQCRAQELRQLTAQSASAEWLPNASSGMNRKRRAQFLASASWLLRMRRTAARVRPKIGTRRCMVPWKIHAVPSDFRLDGNTENRTAEPS